MTVGTIGAPPVVVPRIGDLPALLGDPATELLGVEATPRYVRLKHDAALVAFSVDADNGTGGMFGREPRYVRTFDDRERAAELAAAPHDRRGTLLPGGRSVMFTFPADRALRNIDKVIDPRGLKRILAGVDFGDGRSWRIRARASRAGVASYKPERRLVARVELSLANDADGDRTTFAGYVRYSSGSYAAAAAQTLRTIAEHAPEIDVPRVVATTVARGDITLESALPGDVLDAHHATRADVERALDVMELLHRFPAVLARRVAVADRVRRATTALGVLGTMLPDVRALTVEVAALLRGFDDDDGVCVPVHGDLHAGQFVTTDRSLALVDFDRAGMGDALLDHGAFAASLRAAANPLHELVVEHARQATSATDGRVARGLTIGLVEQALLALRSWRPSWAAIACDLLAAARSAR